MKKTTTSTPKKNPLMRKRKSAVLFAILFSLILFKSPAQLIGWDANNNGGGPANFGISPWPPVAINSNLTIVGTGLIRGSNISTASTAAGGCWGAAGGWGITDNESFYFTFTVNSGFMASLSGISSALRRSTQGPATCNIEFSINNGPYTVAGTWNTSITTGTTGQANSSVLSGFPALQNIAAGTTVRFRITFPGSSGIGNFYVTGGTNCLKLDGVVTTAGPVYGATVTPTGSIQCNGQATGTLTANVSNGTAPYTYSWVPVGGTSSVAANLPAGSYTCIVTDAASATTAATYTLTQPTVLTASMVTSQSVSCNGGNNGSAVFATSGGSPAYTYSWSPAGGTAAIGASLTAGMYTLNITDAHTCTITRTVSITEPAATLSVSASNAVICNGASVTVNAAGATTYTWSGSVANGAPFSPTATAIYTVNATNSANGCVESGTVTINVNPTPTITAASNYTNSTLCNGETVTLTGGGANTYTWTGGITDGVAFTPTATATYSVNGTDLNNCQGNAVITITVNATPTIGITSSKVIICRTESSVLTATGAVTYSWSTNVSAASVTVSPIASTSYSLTGTDVNGCMNTASITQSVSNCIGIETTNAGTAARLSVFPNPSNGAFTIKYANDIDLMIINALGQAVQTIQLNNTNNREVKIDNLNNGVYFIMSTSGGTAIQQKVIVTK